MCERHWAMVPEDQQKRVMKARRGDEFVFFGECELAIAAVREYELANPVPVVEKHKFPIEPEVNDATPVSPEATPVSPGRDASVAPIRNEQDLPNKTKEQDSKPRRKKANVEQSRLFA